MVEVTEADREAAISYLQGKGPWKREEIGLLPDDDYLVQAFATHRIEAAKVERDRLRDLPDEVALDVYERLPAEIDSIDAADIGLIATALADALDSQP